jgi:hypothetical protein
MRRPELTIFQILDWLDAFHRGTGEWPRKNSGQISGSLGETWQAVEMALRNGNRGLPGGSSLARLLADYRGVRNRMNLPRVTERQVLAWMDAHRQRTGMWPTHQCGSSPSSASAPAETKTQPPCANRSSNFSV